MKQKGFTLIELLVVISILGVLVGLIVNNLNDARARARDARKKQNLNQLKTALRLYYNDYQTYPATNYFGLKLAACGENGTDPCPVCPTADFAAGGIDGCETVYMNDLPEEGSYFFFKYYQCNSGDSFRLKTELENKSDPDAAVSQQNCPASACEGESLVFSPQDYVLCAD
jgi:prepilin-type N-terminal cleavage/methylation domain-containing protein